MVSEIGRPLFTSGSPRQAIFIFIGQAGCQIGSSTWTLFNEEHGIFPDGTGYSDDNPICPIPNNSHKDSLCDNCDGLNRTFSYIELKETGKYVPRSLFIDLEPMVIDEIRTGVYRNLFNEDLNFFQFSKMGDGSGIFPRAYYTVGRYIVANLMNSVRRLVERTDQLRIFNISRSYGGATGSGIGSLILENIQDYYPKIILSETNIFNSGLKDSSTLEPYNILFGLESSSSCSGITVLYNNNALQKICAKRLGIKQPLFINYNQLVAYSLSGIYSTERFPGYGNCNMDSILTNLIPYPRVQFPICSLAPITSKEIIRYEKHSIPSDLIKKIISNDYVMFETDLNCGFYISSCMVYRGMVSPGNIAKSHHDLISSKKMRFIEWSPCNIKNGHSSLSLVELPNFNFGVSQLSMIMLANHTNTSLAFEEQTSAVQMMLKKKAFLHWFYQHGIEEEDFNNAIENLVLLNMDYTEITNDPILHSSGPLHIENAEFLISQPKMKDGNSSGPVNIENEEYLISQLKTKDGNSSGPVNIENEEYLISQLNMKDGNANIQDNKEVINLENAEMLISELNLNDKVYNAMVTGKDGVGSDVVSGTMFMDSSKNQETSGSTFNEFKSNYGVKKTSEKSDEDIVMENLNPKNKTSKSCALSLSKTYEQSYIGSCFPKQSVTNVGYFLQKRDFVSESSEFRKIRGCTEKSTTKSSL